MPELTGKAVVSRSRSEFVEGNITALLGGAKAAGEAIGTVGETIFSFWRNVLMS